MQDECEDGRLPDEQVFLPLQCESGSACTKWMGLQHCWRTAILLAKGFALDQTDFEMTDIYRIIMDRTGANR